MAKKLIKEGVILQRGGKRIRPEIGKLFDLTDAEIAQITALRPQALGNAPTVEVDPNSTEQPKGKKSSSGGEDL